MKKLLRIDVLWIVLLFACFTSFCYKSCTETCTTICVPH